MSFRCPAASLGAAALIVASCAASFAGEASVVLRWNELAQRTVAAANPNTQSSTVAIMHLAILDAVAAARRSGAADPVAHVAVATAAYEVLKALHPQDAAERDAALAAGLASVSDENARS